MEKDLVTYFDGIVAQCGFPPITDITGIVEMRI